MTIGKGIVEGTLSHDELRALISASARELGVEGKRVLAIIPDGTRTMPMAQMFRLLQEEIGGRAAACDYLVALGTHPSMSDEQLTQLLGSRVEN
jgi:lactate racemase